VQTNRGAPTPPIAFGDGEITDRLATKRIEVDDKTRTKLEATGAEVTDAPAAIAEASRDWWPLGMIWALDAQVGARASLIVRPKEAGAQLCEVLRICNDARIPVTAAAGRSGVCGASVPAFGGVLLDLTALDHIGALDKESMTVVVEPGVFGDVFEDTLREHGVTCGHWPQSMALSTVGGWLACRGAGQMSTRYGNIENMVNSMVVSLADGTLVATGGTPKQAIGPDLTQLFVGSEGTLGIIMQARMRVHPLPPAEMRAAYAFRSFTDALNAMRRVVQRGATPAVMRLYDAIEADRNYQTGDAHVLLVYDEADGYVIDATRQIVEEECGGADALDAALVGRWFEHRNDVSALEALISRGYVVDTMEVSGIWTALPDIYEHVLAAIRNVEHTMVASVHQSHSYTDGGCLYFTFAGKPPETQREQYYRAAWDAGQRAAIAQGASLSHHHGVGLNRSRFVADALGYDAIEVLQRTKDALDPNGILNPGKLGLRNPFGEVTW
jgi:alkyldihydroxyacetonephosphate synthase